MEITFQVVNIQKDSVLFYNGYEIAFDSVSNFKTAEDADSIVLRLKVTNPEKISNLVSFPMVLYKNKLYPIPKADYQLGIAGEWIKVSPQTQSFQLYLATAKPKMKDFIVLKAIDFPLINVLWLGCLIMIIGTSMAIVNRIKANRKVIA